MFSEQTLSREEFRRHVVDFVWKLFEEVGSFMICRSSRRRENVSVLMLVHVYNDKMHSNIVVLCRMLVIV